VGYRESGGPIAGDLSLVVPRHRRPSVEQMPFVEDSPDERRLQAIATSTPTQAEEWAADWAF
jgi:hypothetical protein